MGRSNNFFIILTVILLSAFLFSITACKDDSSGDGGDARSAWIEVKPGDAYPGYGDDNLKPSCSNYPGTDSAFSFFAKLTGSNNLLIYFQGGGACWHENNCINNPTYSTSQFERIFMLNDAFLSGMGILDGTRAANPFKDWNIVYIPYCTGDLHWGAKDKDYGGGNIIRHRGFVNFMFVLDWIKENFDTDGPDQPDKIFVTGISAGAYGAILNFPYIRDSFSDSSMYVLADAGNGVTTTAFFSAFFAKPSSIFFANKFKISFRLSTIFLQNPPLKNSTTKLKHINSLK